MLCDIVQHDCLTILARGMGLFDLSSQFLSLYSRKETLVFIINMPKQTQNRLELELRQDGCEVAPRSITTEYTPEERSEEYAAGGCIAITSRILAVDLLTRRAPVSSISGFLVWDAHRVSDISSEAFILRLFRQDNKTGFIKGFSDSPEAFGGGFFKVEKVGAVLNMITQPADLSLAGYEKYFRHQAVSLAPISYQGQFGTVSA